MYISVPEDNTTGKAPAATEQINRFHSLAFYDILIYLLLSKKEALYEQLKRTQENNLRTCGYPGSRRTHRQIRRHPLRFPVRILHPSGSFRHPLTRMPAQRTLKRKKAAPVPYEVNPFR